MTPTIRTLFARIALSCVLGLLLLTPSQLLSASPDATVSRLPTWLEDTDDAAAAADRLRTPFRGPSVRGPDPAAGVSRLPPISIVGSAAVGDEGVLKIVLEGPADRPFVDIYPDSGAPALPPVLRARGDSVRVALPDVPAGVTVVAEVDYVGTIGAFRVGAEARSPQLVSVEIGESVGGYLLGEDRVYLAPGVSIGVDGGRVRTIDFDRRRFGVGTWGEEAAADRPALTFAYRSESSNTDSYTVGTTLPRLRVGVRGARSLQIEVHAFSDRPVTIFDVQPESGVVRLEAPVGGTITEARLVPSPAVRVFPQSIPEDPPLSAIVADAGEILRYPQDAFRRADFELFAWDAYPSILVFDTVDYRTQARFFRRAAFFVEKVGYRGRLLTNAELESRHGWNAHNYRGEGLVAFFNAASDAGFPLNPEEVLLRDICVRAGIIVVEGERFVAGTGGVLSISRDQSGSAPLRELLLTHELMHGAYYVNRDFRLGVDAVWESLSAEEREFWRVFMESMTYDPSDEYLMRNEFQAYLLQQSLWEVNWYMIARVAARLLERGGAGAELASAFLESHPRPFAEAAVELNRLLWAHVGFIGGEVRSVVATGG